MPEGKVCVVGVAARGVSSLSEAVREMVSQAEIVFGGERLLEMFPALACEKVVIKNNLAEVAGALAANIGVKRMVVLASGDPNFFGVARYLIERLGKDAVDIIPNVSAMQLAFARIKESWDDAALLSVHSRPVEDIVETVRSSRKIAIFTDDRNTPGEIASVLLQHGIEDCEAHICQDMGSDRERVVSARLSALSGMEFSPLNVLILVRQPAAARQQLGIPEEEFCQREGKALITKLEVRAVTLAKLALDECSTVWDIGAGSGAVSIEVSFVARRGRVFAIEKDPDSVTNIRENVRKFQRPNITVVPGSAPEGLDALPDPTAVFIGGSGGRMAALLDCVCHRLKPGGRVVCNIATLENLHESASSLEANGFVVEVTLVNIARSKDIAGLTRFEPLNPVFIVSGSRKVE